MSIHVVNKRNHKPTYNDFYIGRGSPLGNPFSSNPRSNSLYRASNKDESIGRYRDYLVEQINNFNWHVIDYLKKILKHHKTNDVNLVCYCAPNKCHGDVIKKLLETIEHEISTREQ